MHIDRVNLPTPRDFKMTMVSLTTWYRYGTVELQFDISSLYTLFAEYNIIHINIIWVHINI